MKRNLMYAALLAAALMVSCNGKNTAQNEANTDSTSVTDTTAAESVDLAAVAGTYEGTLPAADCPGIKTVLSLSTPIAHISCSRTISTARMVTTRQAAC